MKHFISVLSSLLACGSALAAVGDTFSYGNGHYEILSEADLTAAFTGFDNARDSFFYPTVERNGKIYTVTEIQKRNGTTRYFNCDFTNYPPSDYKVKVIGDYVFQFTNFDPDKLPKSVEHIGASNFSNRQDLTSVHLPSGLKSIGNGCFTLCRKLTSVTFPYSLETIGLDCFLSCDLREAEIRSCREIGAGAFQDNPKLTKLSLPANLTSIGAQAFNSCTALSEVVIPASLTRIEDRVFRNCENLEYVFFTSEHQPLLRNWNDTEISIDEVFDNMAGMAEIFVPSRKTYTFGTELISFADAGYVYSGQSPELNWANNTPCAVSLITSGLPADAGEHSLTLQARFAEPLSRTINIPVTYTIGKAMLTVTPTDAERLYGDDDPEFTASIEGFKGAETSTVLTKPLKFATTAKKTSDIGYYKISASGSEARNYDFTYKTGTLKVTEAPLIVKPKDVTRLYGDSNPKWEVEYIGLKNGEREPVAYEPLGVYSTGGSDSSVGTYEINVVGGQFHNYYVAEYHPGTLTIEKAPLILKVKDATRLYGKANPTFELDYIGVKDVDIRVGGIMIDFVTQPAIACEANTQSPCGDYAVSVKGGDARNYTIDDRQSGLLHITKRELHVSAIDVQRVYGQENPEFELTFNGFAFGDSEECLTTLPTASTHATKESLPGEYPITLSGGESQNYAFDYGTGTLTVKKMTLRFVSYDNELTYDGEAHLPAYECDGEISEELFRKNLVIEYHTFIPELNAWSYFPADEIRNAGDYKLELLCDEPTVQGVDFAQLTVHRAESKLTILNLDELTEMKVGDQVFIEWECDAPHNELGVLSGSDAPVLFGKVSGDEGAAEKVKYFLSAISAGTGILRLDATGSSNHNTAIAEIPITVNESTGVEGVAAGHCTITTAPLKAVIHGKADSEAVYVHTTTGALVYLGTESVIEVARHGVYLITVGGKCHKVIL